MKVRTGFVSNSSSSSFAIYGLRFDAADARSIFGLTDVDEGDTYELTERLNELFGGESNIYATSGSDEDSVYIGVNLDGIFCNAHKDKTLSQLESELVSELQSKAKDPAAIKSEDLNHHVEGWYDG